MVYVLSSQKSTYENCVPGLGVIWGYGTREALEDSGAFICIDRPGELISVLAEN